jgi:putative transposase
VIEMVRAGASRREAAEEFSVADSTAVKWLQRWEESGSAEAKPRGGSVSPLEAHATLILEVVQAQPDATFVELLVVLKKWGIRTSRSALWHRLEWIVIGIPTTVSSQSAMTDVNCAAFSTECDQIATTRLCWTATYNWHKTARWKSRISR